MIDKYGNDLDYWYYCPICASSYLPSFNTCPTHKKITLVKSQYPRQYYNHKSIEEYCLKKDAYEILWEEEITKNPLYDKEQDTFLVKLEERESEEKVSLYDIRHTRCPLYRKYKDIRNKKSCKNSLIFLVGNRLPRWTGSRSQ